VKLHENGYEHFDFCQLHYYQPMKEYHVPLFLMVNKMLQHFYWSLLMNTSLSSRSRHEFCAPKNEWVWWERGLWGPRRH